MQSNTIWGETINVLWKDMPHLRLDTSTGKLEDGRDSKQTLQHFKDNVCYVILVCMDFVCMHHTFLTRKAKCRALHFCPQHIPEM
jgi:hypothetical protein